MNCFRTNMGTDQICLLFILLPESNSEIVMKSLLYYLWNENNALHYFTTKVCIFTILSLLYILGSISQRNTVCTFDNLYLNKTWLVPLIFVVCRALLELKFLEEWAICEPLTSYLVTKKLWSTQIFNTDVLSTRPAGAQTYNSCFYLNLNDQDI